MNWKEIKEFPGYSISSSGLVKSNQRAVNRRHPKGSVHKRILNERILKVHIDGPGYGFVSLSINNKASIKKVHHLVAEHFLGERPKGLVVHHKDGNKLNNDISNLEYTSKQRNTQHYFNSIGKSMGKVPISSVASIIHRINLGEECQHLANEYNVTRNDIAVLCKIIDLTGKELEIKPFVEEK